MDYYYCTRAEHVNNYKYIFFSDCEQWIHRYCLDSLEEQCPKKKKNRPPSSVFNIPRPHAGKPLINNLMLYKYLDEFNVGGGDEQILFFTIGV